MRIDVWMDVVCPWCFIGKTRLDRALAQAGIASEVEVIYRSYRLSPERIVGTAPLIDKMAAFGMGREVARQRIARSTAAAAADGLIFYPGDRVVGDTTMAHRVLHLARERGLQRPVLENFLRRHFMENHSLFDATALAALSQEAGLDGAEVTAMLAGDDYAPEVEQEDREGHGIVREGVPTFVFDRRLMLSGSQPIEAFLAAFAQMSPAE
jgi:predicted DsbA family dithiol-disulfide isomerase